MTARDKFKLIILHAKRDSFDHDRFEELIKLDIYGSGETLSETDQAIADSMIRKASSSYMFDYMADIVMHIKDRTSGLFDPEKIKGTLVERTLEANGINIENDRMIYILYDLCVLYYREMNDFSDSIDDSYQYALNQISDDEHDAYCEDAQRDTEESAPDDQAEQPAEEPITEDEDND